MPKLIVKLKDKIINELVLSKDTFTIGRLPENDLYLDNNLASRRHCKLVKKGKEYMLHDLDSANGTFLNKKITKTATLKEGDEIQIGDNVLVYEEEKSAPTQVAPKTGMAAAMSSDIVKSIDDISMGYRLDAKEILDQGQSLVMAAKPIARTKESERFFILYQLGKAVTSAPSLPEVLDIAMSSIFDFIKADRGLIMLIDKESGKLIPQVTRRRQSKDSDESIHVSRTITDKVINDKVSILTTDAKYDSRFESGMSIAQYNIRSALCVPLWEKQEILGVIYLDNLIKTHAFSNDDLELLTAVANQIAIRIKQDELYGTLKKEAVMRSNLERYHSPDVVERIIHQAQDGKAILEVEEKKISVLFADIQDFTTISERVSPREVAQMLNEFFETTTQIIFEHKGSVNKYIGDCVLATFGAPVDLENHAVQATQAGVEMAQKLDEIQKEDNRNIPKYRVRVGINTGLVVAGNVGAKKRIEYAILGDTVNVASRLNQYGGPNEVVVAEATYEQVKDLFNAKDLGAVKLKGKKKEVKAYQLSKK